MIPITQLGKKHTKKWSDLPSVNQPARGGPGIDPKSGILTPESVHFATILYSLSNKPHVTILKSYWFLNQVIKYFAKYLLCVSHYSRHFHFPWASLSHISLSFYTQTWEMGGQLVRAFPSHMIDNQVTRAHSYQTLFPASSCKTFLQKSFKLYLSPLFQSSISLSSSIRNIGILGILTSF